MALGSARLFNINLTQNFNSPYLATSVIDFWRRWHISFSRWILDYIFKPLQMGWRSWKNLGTAGALIATFLVSGIWHGASWGFVIWGGLHGLYMACSVIYKPYQKRLHKELGIENTRFLKIWQVFVTFNLVCFAWVFFRATRFGDALYVIYNTLKINAIYTSIKSTGILKYVKVNVFMGLGRYEFITIASFLIAIYFFLGKKLTTIFTRPIWQRWLIYYTLLITIWLFHVQNIQTKFLYFTF